MVTLSTYGVAIELIGPANAVALMRTELLERCGWHESADATPQASCRISATADASSMTIDLHATGERVWSGQVAAHEVGRAGASAVHHLVGLVAPHHVFVHAGCVEFGGVAVVLPGRSQSGKTTLVRALLEVGASYLSDEFAVLDPHGGVHPYPKPLALRESDSSRRWVSPADLGATQRIAPVHRALVIAAEFEPNTRFVPQPLSPSHAAQALALNALALQHAPQKTLDACAALARQAPAFSGARGSADAAAKTIGELVERHAG